MSLWTRWLKTLPARRRAAARPVRRPLGVLKLLEDRAVPAALHMSVVGSHVVYGSVVTTRVTLDFDSPDEAQAYDGGTLSLYVDGTRYGHTHYSPPLVGWETGITGGVRLTAGTHTLQATLTHSGQDTVTSDLFSFTVDRKPLTVTGVTADDKTYDDTTAATVHAQGASLVGVLSGDTVRLQSGHAVGAFADPRAGTGKTVTVTGLSLAGDDAGNYSIGPVTVTADILPRPVVVSVTSADNKVYDGTDNATLRTAGATLLGVLTGDDVSPVLSGATAAFDDKRAGSNKLVYVSGIGLTGPDAGNYFLYNPATTTRANITPRALTLTGLTAADKVYDGTDNATPRSAGATLAGVVAGDAVTIDLTRASAAFDDKRAGSNKVVFIGGIALAGADAGNYTLTATTATTTAAITPKALTVTGVRADDKTYDGTNNATLRTDGAALVGVVAGDAVTLDASHATGTFESRFALSYSQDVTVRGLALAGADAGNYTLTRPAPASARIRPKSITLTGVRALDKVYDGSDTAPLDTSEAHLDGVLAQDADRFTIVGSFPTKSVGTRSVEVHVDWSNAFYAASYRVFTQSLTASITPRPLAVTGVTASDKDYDGTTAATVHATGAVLVGAVSGDAVTLDASHVTGRFDTKFARTTSPHPVTVSGLSLAGADAGDYTLTQPTTSAYIFPKLVTVSGVTASDKVYDGTAAAALDTSHAHLDGLLSDDASYVDTVSGTYPSKAVGSDLPITIRVSFTRGGIMNNYRFSAGSLTADITPRALTVTGVTADSKTYDGTTAATIHTAGAALVGVVAGDSVTLDVSHAAGAFSTPNVNFGRPVTVTGLALAGADTGNYTLTPPVPTADVYPRPVSLTGVTVRDKVYDGGTAAPLDTSHAHLDGLVAQDADASYTIRGTFPTKNVISNVPVQITVSWTSDALSRNYVVSTESLRASITPRPLTVSGVAADDKVYDGTTATTLRVGAGGVSLVGVVSGDAVGLNALAARGAFADPRAGTGKTVTVTGLALTGGDAGNYTLPSTAATVTANILPRRLTVSGMTAADDKVYDGTDNATLRTTSATLAGVLAGDAVTADLTGAAAAFDDKRVGSDKPVYVSGIGLTGPDAGNYTLTATTATTRASITPKALTVTGITADDKVYDHTTAATLRAAGATLAGVVSGDQVSLITAGAAGRFADDWAGANKPVTVTGLSIAGADAANYTLTLPTPAAAITRRPLTISAVVHDKVYDGTTNAGIFSFNFAPSVVDPLVIEGTARFADKNAGANKPVTVSGISIFGQRAVNYLLLNITATATATITPRPLTITAAAQDKVIDGTTAATVTLSDNRVRGDLLTVGYTSAAFADAIAGMNKTVTVSGISITGGADATNYTLANTTATTTATIAVAAVTPIFTIADKVYDGATAAVITGRSLAGVLPDDIGNITLIGGTAAFPDKNAGVGKTVTITGFRLSGPGAGKYLLTGTIAMATASIGQATLTVTAGSYARQYSDPNPSLSASITGFVRGETLATSGVTGSAAVGTAATASSPVGQYAITAGPGTLSAYNYAFRFNPGVLYVTPEDAQATYTGTTYAATASASDTFAAVTLLARIETGTLADLSDSTTGDLSTAVVAFIDRATGQVLADNVPVTVNPSDPRQGTASVVVSLPLSTPSNPGLFVDVRVKGNYAASPVANCGASLVEVASQAARTISGGGTLVNANTFGQLTGDAGQVTNFAFTVQTGASPAGGVSLLVRKGAGTGSNLYLISGTSLRALSTTANSAVVLVGGTIRDVSDPARPLLIDDNVTIRLSAQDGGAGGAADTVGVTVRKANGDIWFNSSFSAGSPNALAQALAGGDVAVVTPQRLAGPPAAGGAVPALTEAQLAPVVAAAAERWRAAGVPAARLQAAMRGLTIRIDDLPGSDLGSAGDGIIRLDRDAAGYGWFVDPTPADDAEFVPGAEHSPAAGRVDLLTVVAHELGHALGLDSDGGNGVMGEFLPTGVRRLPIARGAAVTAEPIAWVAPAKRPCLYAALLADSTTEEMGLPD